MIGNTTLEALCGREVVHPQLAEIWDEQPMGEPVDLDNPYICRKCKLAYREIARDRLGREGVYALVPGEEAIHAEIE
jgi:hypothetical protein